MKVSGRKDEAIYSYYIVLEYFSIIFIFNLFLKQSFVSLHT